MISLIVDPIITYTLTSLPELVNGHLTDAQANGLLCYKCKLIFRIYYKRVSYRFWLCSVRLDEVSENKSVIDGHCPASPHATCAGLPYYKRGRAGGPRPYDNYRINKLIFMKPHLPGLDEYLG